MKKDKETTKIVLIYTTTLLFWITFLEKFMYDILKNKNILSTLMQYKDYSFLLFSSLLMFVLFKYEGNKHEALKTKLEITSKMLEQSNQDFKIALSTKSLREKELEYEASYDELTGLYNRKKGLKLFDEELKLCKEKHRKLLVCFIDIDGLKNVNDIYGHEQGDTLITAVSSLLKNATNDNDIICRLGGDEFLIVFKDCGSKDITKIKNKFENFIFYANLNSNKPYKISFSQGFSEYNYTENKDIHSLINIADKKMYEQKKARKLEPSIGLVNVN